MDIDWRNQFRIKGIDITIDELELDLFGRNFEAGENALRPALIVAHEVGEELFGGEIHAERRLLIDLSGREFLPEKTE